MRKDDLVVAKQPRFGASYVTTLQEADSFCFIFWYGNHLLILLSFLTENLLKPSNKVLGGSALKVAMETR